MLFQQDYGIITSEDEYNLFRDRISTVSLFNYEIGEWEQKSSNGILALKTPLNPKIGLVEIINRFPNFEEMFNFWFIDGWKKGMILGVNGRVLELPEPRVVIYGKNFSAVEILRTELTFVDVDEIFYPRNIAEMILELGGDIGFEMVKRKARSIALGLYSVFEKKGVKQN